MTAVSSEDDAIEPEKAIFRGRYLWLEMLMQHIKLQVGTRVLCFDGDQTSKQLRSSLLGGCGKKWPKPARELSPTRLEMAGFEGNG